MCKSGLFTLKDSGTNVFQTDGNAGGKQRAFFYLSHRPGPAWREEQCADMGQFEGLTAP